MKTYIILLRGINVSGKNKIPMAELRNLLNDLGFQNVQTYIQSGNIILESEKSKSVICQEIKEAIKGKFGFEVPVLARTIPEWKKAIANYPFPIDNTKIVAFVFLNRKIYETKINVKGIHNDEYLIDNDMVYIYCPTGFAKTKLSNNLFERKLNVTATTRNYNTTLKLLELAIK
ncbi:DUF1697 domain-containing protein [Polaribacter sp. Hel1_85]|uniref:DUF1697 domain-containing protein n=1 Tax=Polaribacter sp. Hel1_85 TaxID=1250005 RepID=UPI00052DE534|nr:DUF1697 domain-containing protein [Polaribacter sp. Hel1_85]KGL64227.1 hypothetical protein PHEL85_1279 [Polaribacter sp. Hel1_85]